MRDAKAYVDLGEVEPDRPVSLFEEIRSELVRYPHLDAELFGRAVRDFAHGYGGTDLSILPGDDLVAQGLVDLHEAALLVLVAAPRLRRLGFEVPRPDPSPAIPEHALFERVEARPDRGAHAAYNALLARMSSFADAYGPAVKAGRTRTSGPP